MSKVALVTGSSKGIGKGIAKKLVENGYIVYINGRNTESVQRTIDELGSKNCRKLVCDFMVEEEISKAIEFIWQNEQRLDLVVSNIGSGKSKIGIEANTDEYRRVFDINFFNSVALTNKVIEKMKDKGGNIILIASIAGCEPLGAPITYSSAKTALISFAKNISKVIAKYNIRINCISPGNVMFEGSTWDDKMKADKKKVEDYIEQNVPLNSFAKPEDIGDTAIFLENSGFITGANIVVDGGQINKLI